MLEQQSLINPPDFDTMSSDASKAWAEARKHAKTAVLDSCLDTP